MLTFQASFRINNQALYYEKGNENYKEKIDQRTEQFYMEWPGEASLRRWHLSKN